MPNMAQTAYIPSTGLEVVVQHDGHQERFPVVAIGFPPGAGATGYLLYAAKDGRTQSVANLIDTHGADFVEITEVAA